MRIHSLSFHLDSPLTLYDSTRLVLYSPVARPAYVSFTSPPLFFFSPLLLLLILFSVYPLVHISPLLFSHFSSLRPRYLPVRALLDRRVLYRQCPPAVTCTWLFHTRVPCVDPNRTNNFQMNHECGRGLCNLKTRMLISH